MRVPQPMASVRSAISLLARILSAVALAATMLAYMKKTGDRRVKSCTFFTALTGGYRKTPVLQVGADIYCDTALIARRLEAEKAAPALFPEGQEFNVGLLAQWADSVLFQHAVALVFQPESMALRFAKVPPEFAKAFAADRSALVKLRVRFAPRLATVADRQSLTERGVIERLARGIGEASRNLVRLFVRSR